MMWWIQFQDHVHQQKVQRLQGEIPPKELQKIAQMIGPHWETAPAVRHECCPGKWGSILSLTSTTIDPLDTLQLKTLSSSTSQLLFIKVLSSARPAASTATGTRILWSTSRSTRTKEVPSSARCASDCLILTTSWSTILPVIPIQSWFPS